MKRTLRRNPNPHLIEKNEEPFFPKGTSSNTMEAKPFFQTSSLKIGQPGDKYEKEADAVADAVVNHSGNGTAIQKKEISAIQRDSLATPLEDEKRGTAEQRMEEDKRIQEKPELQTQEEEEEEMQMQQEEEEEEMQMQQEEEEEEMQMKTDAAAHHDPVSSGGPTSGPGIIRQLNQSSGKGQRMKDRIKNEMESAFGYDFDEVRIHTGTEAGEMNHTLHARAFTYGKDIYFNRGKYNPETTAGKKLIAHELTHVVQQQKRNKKNNRTD